MIRFEKLGDECRVGGVVEGSGERLKGNIEGSNKRIDLKKSSLPFKLFSTTKAPKLVALLYQSRQSLIPLHLPDLLPSAAPFMLLEFYFRTSRRKNETIKL
jgi:hypothetical protein